MGTRTSSGCTSSSWPSQRSCTRAGAWGLHEGPLAPSLHLAPALFKDGVLRERRGEPQQFVGLVSQERIFNREPGVRVAAPEHVHELLPGDRQPLHAEGGRSFLRRHPGHAASAATWPIDRLSVAFEGEPDGLVFLAPAEVVPAISLRYSRGNKDREGVGR